MSNSSLDEYLKPDRANALGETLTSKDFDEYLSEDGLDNVTFGDRVPQDIIDRYQKERMGTFDEPKRSRSSGRVSKREFA